LTPRSETANLKFAAWIDIYWSCAWLLALSKYVSNNIDACQGFSRLLAAQAQKILTLAFNAGISQINFRARNSPALKLRHWRNFGICTNSANKTGNLMQLQRPLSKAGWPLLRACFRSKNFG
jgi:hypothetical protein